jgi:isoamylase/glycogen operon protein
MAGEFATRICGSQDLYGEGGHPYHSINFVTSHDGFTLRDLVSYENKHNEMNGEENRDGGNDNYTWNCGVEGPSTDSAIQKLRLRQMKNMYFALLVSQGIPMIHMGDEYGHTKRGNNNTWCQDNRLNWFLWDQLEKGEGKEFFAFCSFLNKFRLQTAALKNEKFLQPEDIIWHGMLPNQPDWSGKIVVFTLIDHEKHCDIYIAFNASHEPIELQLPKLDKGQNWKLILDTSQQLGAEKIIKKEKVALQPYSSLLAQKTIFKGAKLLR